MFLLQNCLFFYLHTTSNFPSYAMPSDAYLIMTLQCYKLVVYLPGHIDEERHDVVLVASVNFSQACSECCFSVEILGNTLWTRMQLLKIYWIPESKILYMDYRSTNNCHRKFLPIASRTPPVAIFLPRTILSDPERPNQIRINFAE